MKAFYCCDMYNTGDYSVRFSEEIYSFFGWTTSSYVIVPARILGLSFAEYLRFARDKFDGILDGKSSKYVTVTFKDKSKCEELCKVLNKRWREMM